MARDIDELLVDAERLLHDADQQTDMSSSAAHTIGDLILAMQLVIEAVRLQQIRERSGGDGA